MRRPILLLMTFLMVTASLVLTLASASLDRPMLLQTSPSRGVSTVMRYYDAVNHMIATGDPVALREVVHPDMSDIIPPTIGRGGREGIEDYLSYLHSVLPKMYLEARPAAAEGTEVIAQVTVMPDSDSLPLGFLADQSSLLWPSTEVFLVSGNQIIEREFRWDRLATIYPADEFPMAIDMPAQHVLQATLDRYSSQDQAGFTTGRMPEIHHVVSGELLVSLSQWASAPALVHRSTPDELMETRREVLPGDARSVLAGDMLIVPPESAYSLINSGNEDASIIRVSTSNRSAGDIVTIDDVYNLPSSRPLLSLPFESLDGEVHLSFGELVMMPGSRLAVDPEITLMVIWNVDGQLASTTGRADCIESGYSGSPQPGDEQQLASLHLLCPGASEDHIVFNTGAGPATAWVLAVTAGQPTS